MFGLFSPHVEARVNECVWKHHVYVRGGMVAKRRENSRLLTSTITAVLSDGLNKKNFFSLFCFLKTNSDLL